jgi:hypothetical protein
MRVCLSVRAERGGGVRGGGAGAAGMAGLGAVAGNGTALALARRHPAAVPTSTILPHCAPRVLVPTAPCFCHLRLSCCCGAVCV